MIRTFNWLGQMRVDVPHLRAVESSVVATFDVLAGKLMAGSRAQVVKGFEVIGSSGMASALQISVAGAVLLHPMASENGSVFSVPPTRANEILSAANSRVRGNFTPSQVNYVGVDLLRSADSSTSDLVQFLDSVQEQETPKTVPLGRTLDYVIVISTVDFAITPNIAPIAKITTDGANGVVSVQDARDMLFRLSRGGSVPSETYAYPWPGGRTGTSFTVGDKSIDSLKSFAEAVTTRLWELGGGSHWYSPTADRNVKLVRSGSTFSNGDYFEWDGNTGNLHWKGLRMVFDNSDSPSVWYNDITDVTVDTANLTDLPSGYCIYVDLDRTSNATLTAVKAEIQTLGAPTVPGTRHILAWNNNGTIFTRDAAWPVGVSFLPATKTSNGVVTLNEDPLDALQPVVATVNSNDTVVGAGVQRGATLGAGAVSVGGGTNDSSVSISKAGAATTVYDALNVNSGDITAVSGNIVANSGDITADSGNIVATSGDITADSGDIVATAGDIVATAGNITATAGDIVATAGNITATAGDIAAINGTIEASQNVASLNGSVVAGGDPSSDGGRLKGKQIVTSTGAAPTIADASAAIGVGYANLTVDANSTDACGEISFDTGTGAGAGALVVVTLNKPYTNRPYVVISPANDEAASGCLYVFGSTASGGSGGKATFTVGGTASVVDSTTYTLTYHVIGTE